MEQQRAPNLTDCAAMLVDLAMARGVSLTGAESCSGGLIAHALTLIPGISAVYLGGVVAYANAAKRDLLGVEAALLTREGAVSEAVALAMARGACARFGADLALATTGIAGPGGATPEKPVGLTYVAVAGVAGELCREFRFTGTRAENISAAAREALWLGFVMLSTHAG